MDPIVGQLFAMFAPIAADVIRNIRTRHQDPNYQPTDEEMQSEFEANGDLYLGEGAAWKIRKGRT